MSEKRKIYEVNEIQSILGLSRTGAYEFIRKTYKEKSPFRVLKIGRKYLIPGKEFEEWIYGE